MWIVCSEIYGSIAIGDTISQVPAWGMRRAR
jgi:hypothetical protein